jgi:hypothetical protein
MFIEIDLISILSNSSVHRICPMESLTSTNQVDVTSVSNDDNEQDTFVMKPTPSERNLSIDFDRQYDDQLFQRIETTGNIQNMSHVEDLDDVLSPLLSALVIREK